MLDQLNIRIAGEAGQGIETTGQALYRIYRACGKHVFANQDYMSRIRGGNNFFQLRIADEPVRAIWSKCDIVAALDKESVWLHKGVLESSGIMIVDRKKFNIPEESGPFFDVPYFDLAQKTGGSEIFVNTAMLGVIACITGVDFGELRKSIYDIFSDKSEDIVKLNVEAAIAGFEHAKDKFNDQKFRIKPVPAGNRLLMDANQAIALGAVRAGCKFYSAYPMTPSTGIMNSVSHFAGRFGIVVEQAEDELAAINMAIGASFSGARSMCATSGGGFALMEEGFSLAGMTETPVVVVNGQRPGPATGFPTRTEQGDLEMLIHAAHGEFARAIYAPGSIEEAFYLTVRAFYTADKYQIPVIIMTDQYLADSVADIEPFDLARAEVQRFAISRQASKQINGYKRYSLTEDGISPRAVPSWIEDVIYADSDEHTEEGHITEDAGIRIRMVEKRFHKKMRGLSQELVGPVTFDMDKNRTVLVGFGSTHGLIKEAARKLGLGCLHLPQVWPFPAQALTALLKEKRVVTIENNATGQLMRLIKRETGIVADNMILRYDGRPFYLDELIRQLREIIK